jgi:predicted RNA-binding Zn ribbon-like protein
LARQPQQDEEFRDGMPFVGGRLWLDLLNTTPFDGTAQQDLIASGEAWRRWLAAAGLPAPAERQQDTAARAARQFRESLRATVGALRNGAGLPAKLIAELNERIDGARRHLRLEPGPDGPHLVEWLEDGPASAAAAIAEDYARFVCDYEPERLKPCANPTCTMVFYDTGRNNTRRWCTMSICGNRDKVARYRSRQAGKPPGRD